MVNKRPLLKFSYHTRLRLLLVPYALGIIFLVLLPALISFALAFYQYDALSPPRFIGRLNFILPGLKGALRFHQDLRHKLSKSICDRRIRCGSQVLVKLTLYEVATPFRYRSLYLFN